MGAPKSTSLSREDGLRTKARILDAAEQCFADEGFLGASMRKILASAGANVAAGHYHFGSKENLYWAVIARYMEPLNEERLKALTTLSGQIEKNASKEAILKSLIHAYIAPHLRLSLSKQGRRYGHLVAQFLVENDELTRPIYTEHIYPLRAAFARYFKFAFPGVANDQMEVYFDLIALTMSMAADANSPRATTDKAVQKRITEVTAFLTGGIIALAEEQGV